MNVKQVLYYYFKSLFQAYVAGAVGGCLNHCFANEVKHQRAVVVNF